MRSPATLELLVVLGVLVVGTGCGTRRASHPLSPTDLTQLARDLDTNDARVTFVDPIPPHRLMQATGKPRLETDRIVMTGRLGRQPIPLSQVREVDASRKGRGAVTGFLTGFAVGGMAGMALGQNCSPPADFSCVPKRGLALFSGAVLGVAGMFVGAAMGSSPHWYIDPPADAER